MNIIRRHTLAVEPYLVWAKRLGGGWDGVYENRPMLRDVFSNQWVDWDKLSKELGKKLLEHYPDHLGLIGTPTFGRLRTDAPRWLTLIVAELYRRAGSFSPTEEQIEGVMLEFGEWLTEDAIELEFIAPLINFSMSPVHGEIILSEGIVLRALTDDEASELFGGSPFSMQMQSRVGGPIEFALFGTIKEAKALKDLPENSSALDSLRDALDRIILALRTYKDGPVGIDKINIRSRYLSPLPGIHSSWRQEYVSFGSYTLTSEEASEFPAHARLFAGKLHPTLEVACDRLSDAAVRLRPRDRIIDAAIGLEAILLSGVGDKQYIGELRYRFSLNYAALSRLGENRREAFVSARRLYDLRSVIAHGGPIRDGKVHLNDKQIVSVDEGAKQATDILRSLIQRFLSSPGKPEYLQDGYWDNLYFDLPAESS